MCVGASKAQSIMHTIGAVIVRIGFGAHFTITYKKEFGAHYTILIIRNPQNGLWGPLNYNYNKEPPK